MENNPLSHFSNEIDHESLIEQFIANLHTLHTEVSHIHRSEIGSALQYVVHKFNVQSAVYWDDDRLHQLEIGKHLIGISFLIECGKGKKGKRTTGLCSSG